MSDVAAARRIGRIGSAKPRERLRVRREMSGSGPRGQRVPLVVRLPRLPRGTARGLWGVVVAVLATSAAWADAPRVVSATPDNGDTNVDPGLKELRIEFDQDMRADGHSLCGGGERFPKITGRARWEKKRIFTIPVRLEPEHEYAFSVNCPAAQNFRGANGEAAEIYPISFRTGPSNAGAPQADGRGADAGAADAAPKATPERNQAAVRELRRAIDEEYSYRDLRGVDWDKLFAEHGPKLEKARTPAAFARDAARLLANAADPHVWLVVDGVTIPSHRRNVAPNYDAATLARVVPGWTRHNPCVSTGRFEDGIGYILIASWSGDCREGLEAAFAALGEMSDAKGLVVDVRPNGGGSEDLALEFAGCFVEEPKLYSRNTTRAKNQPGGFAGPFDRVVRPNPARPAWRGRVAVLMGPANLSSCESFLLMMKQVTGCRLVGQTSGGSSGNPRPHELPNGVTVFLPSWRDMLPDGTLLEGRGVEPDISVPTEPGAFGREDPVLSAALKLLRAN